MSNKPLTIHEFASLGGKARWAKVKKKARSRAMKDVRARVKKVINTPTSKPVDTNKHVE